MRFLSWIRFSILYFFFTILNYIYDIFYSRYLFYRKTKDSRDCNDYIFFFYFYFLFVRKFKRDLYLFNPNSLDLKYIKHTLGNFLLFIIQSTYTFRSKIYCWMVWVPNVRTIVDDDYDDDDVQYSAEMYENYGLLCRVYKTTIDEGP